MFIGALMLQQMAEHAKTYVLVTKLTKFCFLLVYCYIVTRGPESTVEWSNFSIIFLWPN